MLPLLARVFFVLIAAGLLAGGFVSLSVGGQEEAGLVPNGDGTVSDVASGLMWLHDADYARSLGISADGRMTRQQALRLISLMNTGQLDNFGYTDWRLPTAGELSRLFGT